MDPRCPRKLKDFPDGFCPLAVLRLKALRNAEQELTEEEENKLPGCNWAVSHQMCGYCFFSFMARYADEGLSDVEIASMNSISVDTVKKIEKKALAKLKEFKEMEELRECVEGKTEQDFNILF